MQQFISRLFGPNTAMSLSFMPTKPLNRSATRQIYSLLDVYYQNNALYDQLQRAAYAQALGVDNLVALRNPVNRVVECYPVHLWPGTLPDALPIIADNEALPDAIHQIWQWSNWNAQKQVMARWLALYGDTFTKVVQTDDRRRVFFQMIRPHFVTDLNEDERGVLEYIRIDVPQAIRQGDRIVQMTHTEVWTGESYRLWQHDRNQEHDHVTLEELGAPVTELPLTAFGIDFIPIVHTKFRDIGDPRGVGAITHALDKIDEANRVATRLHQMLFRYNSPVWAVESTAMDKDGRPLAPPRIGKADATDSLGGDTITLGDDSLLKMPSGWSLKQMVPNVPYHDALTILDAHLMELEADMPEMAFYRLRQLNTHGSLSGRAVRLILSDAVSRVLEVRGNAESGLIRLNQMALTIGQTVGLFDASIGTYDTGDFEHHFADRQVIPVSDLEEAEAVTALTGIVSVEEQMRRLGMTDDEITQNIAEKKADQPVVVLPAAAPENPSQINAQNRIAAP